MIKKLLLIGCGLLAAEFAGLRAAILLQESFTYPDGSLATASVGKWSTHSGTAGQADVISGRVNLTETESEDVNAPLDGQPYPADSGAVLYARFKVSFSALPSGTGGYFAHFKDGTTSGFRARVFATTTGAAPGTFRLGIANAAGSANATVPADLAVNVEHTVVIKYDVGAASSTLWVNPASEADTPAAASDSTSTLPIATFAFRQSLSGGNGMGVLSVDDLVVATSFGEALNGPSAGAAATISSQPADATVRAGSAATFTVVANGTEPFAYQWRFGGVDLPGATNATYAIAAAQAGQAGTYQVVVSNAFGSAISREAVLVVTPGNGAPIATTIADLRQRVDPITYALTNTTQLFTVEGFVTTHVNVTTDANALFYIQDNTAGIAVFVSGGAMVRPAAGDLVRVTGPLGQFNGLLQLTLVAANAVHSVATVTSGNPLPAPKPLAFSIQSDPAQVQPLVGSRVMVTNVTLDISNPNFPGSSGGNVTMTNLAGETFVLRVDARVTDITSQPKPTVPVNIVGVLGQFDNSSPFTSGHQLLPTRFADIIGGAVAPKIGFTNVLTLVRKGDSPTNVFGELVLLPGESATITASATKSDGSALVVTTRADAGAWQAISPFAAAFTYAAAETNAGQKLTVEFSAANSQATNTAVWTIYVPTAAERGLIVSEFSANAPGANANPYGNILNRAETPPAPNSDDEFVELVNMGSEGVDLRNWTIGDSVQVRHKFYDSFVLGPTNAAIVYGGPLNGAAPQLDVSNIPASENAFGFGLNNSGGDSIVLRNAAGNLVSRIVYTTLGTNSTMTRHPGLNDSFVPQLTVSTNVATPGRRFDGQGFDASPVAVAPGRLAVAKTTNGQVRIVWESAASQPYSVLAADRPEGPYSVLESGTSGGNSGEFTTPAQGAARYFIIRTP